jgi:hypothetical protein
MRREGDVIIFDQVELADFPGLHQQETVEDTLLTALIFHDLAHTITERTQANRNSTNKDSAHMSNIAEHNAGKLARFATKVFDLCIDEHAAHLAAQPDKTLPEAS